ncbi:MAG: universal stress protein [Rhodomicrobium sp.]|jgi:nucleotide-binding universal stress UspA family protein
MSIKTILVYIPSEKSAAAVLTPALKIAVERSAHLIGFHLIADLPVYGEFPAEVSEDVIARLQKAGKEAAAGAKRAFDEHVQKSGPITFEWRCFAASYGAGNDLIAQNGRAADLIVCGKPSEEAPDAWSDFSETAIMRSGRPVLIVPVLTPHKTLGEHVIIAWNDTREAARAVFDSIDLLKAASTVRALTLIEKEHQREAAEALGADLIASLARHGVAASLDVSYAGAGSAGEAILSRLLEEGCDLLIMGGYSHSRLREMIFGGVSRDILRGTWVPTLVSH